MELSAGFTFGPYRLVERAGAGGMAEVWRAYDVRLKRYVAVKFLSPRYATETTYLERFLREAQAVSRLDHPNILTIYDYGEQDNWTYMVSPYIGGGTLAERLHRGPWPLEEAVATLEPLASALDYAHGEGIIHRDVKPSNVLFTERGRLVLSDFGVARMIEGTSVLSQAGLVVGTPMYMSPEQAEGEPAIGASDLYSLGVVAYEMLTGRPPFRGETPLALLRAHVDKPLPPPRSLNPGLTEPVEAALFTILAKQPGDRYASGSAFVGALRADEAPAPSPVPDAGYAPTLPLDEAATRPDPRAATGPGRDAVRTSTDVVRPIPRPPTTPLGATVPLDAAGQPATRRSALGLIAMSAVAWAVALALLLTLRAMSYVPVYDVLGDRFSDGGLPWLMARFVAGVLVGLIGGTGLTLGLLWAGLVRERRAAMLLIGGWALSYGIGQVVLYAFGRTYDLPADAIDELLSFNPELLPVSDAVLLRLGDVVPALVGGWVTASLLRRPGGSSSITVILGWGFAAVLAVGVVLVTTNILGGSGQLDLLSGPRRYGVIVGGSAGLVQGLVGGWRMIVGVQRTERSP